MALGVLTVDTLARTTRFYIFINGIRNTALVATAFLYALVSTMVCRTRSKVVIPSSQWLESEYVAAVRDLPSRPLDALIVAITAEHPPVQLYFFGRPDYV